MKLEFIKNRLKLGTLKLKLFYSAVCFLILAIVSIGGLSYYLYWDTSLKKVYENNHNYNMTIQESVSTIVQETIDYSNSLLSDPQLNSILKDITDSGMNSNTGDIIKKLNYKLLSVMEYRNDIAGISVITGSFNYSKGDMPMVNDRQINSEGFYAQLSGAVNTSMVLQEDNIRSTILGGLAGQNIYVAGMSRYGDFEWIVILKLNAEFIAMEKNDVKSLIASSSGKVIYSNIPRDYSPLAEKLISRYHSKPEGDFVYAYGNEAWYVSYDISYYNGWIYASIMDSQPIRSQKTKVLAFMLLIGLILLILMSSLAYFISNKLVMPLKKLGESIRNIQDLDGSSQEEDNRRVGEYWLKRINFKGKLMLFYSSLIICSSLVFVTVFYQYTRSIIMGQVVETAVQSLDQTAKNIEFIMQKSERISAYIAINEDIQGLIAGKPESKDSVKDMSSYIINEGFLKNGVSYIDLYNSMWEKVYSTGNADLYHGTVDPNVINSFKEATFYKQWLRMKHGILKDYTISFLRKIRSGSNSSERYSVIGYLDLGVDESFIEQKYRVVKWGQDSRTMIIDNNEVIVSSGDKMQIGKPVMQLFPHLDTANNVGTMTGEQGEVLYTLYSPVKAFDWKLVSVIPEREMMREYFGVLTLNIVALLVITIIMLEIVNSFANHISKPIYIINRALNEVYIGNLDVDISYHGRDEFGLLCESFRDVMSRLSDLFNELYEGKLREKDLENRKKEVQLICLQQQINPHFLYNTFTSIKFLIKMGRTEEAAEMVTMVGDMFRIGVYRGRIIVDTREELEHIRTYLTIQQIRYREKLKVSWDIEESVYQHKTLKFILQPIVENAIYHGIEVMEGQGLLALKAYKTQEAVCFEITDNGPGMDSAKLHTINTQMLGKESTGSIGLRNVDERIKMYFGHKYGLHIFSTPGSGTTVRIVIPVIGASDAEGKAYV